MLETLWSSLADCRGCRRGALFGAVLGWALAGLTILAGDRQQLALAAVLAAMGLTALWGLHRLAVSIKGVPTPFASGRASSVALVEEPLAERPETTAAAFDASEPVAETTRFDLTDLEWSVIEPLLPANPRGGARTDERRVLNGILWRLRSGAAWASIPDRYGPYTICASRFNRWRKAGIWDKILAAVTRVYDGEVQMIDSSSVKAHRPSLNYTTKAADPVAWLPRAVARQGLF
jgi:putative transposase